MAYNSTLRASIAGAIKTPADPRITGAILQAKLLAMVDAIDAGALFLGVANPSSSPSTQVSCFYLAVTAGNYSNFRLVGNNGTVSLANGEVALIYSVLSGNNIRWAKATIFSPGGSDFGNVLTGLGFESFDTAKPYGKGEVVIYSNILYTFISSKDAGVWDASKTKSITLEEGLAEAEIFVKASDITPKSQLPVDVAGKFVIQTTGGDADIQSGPALLRSIKGNLSDDLTPFLATSLVSTGMNLVDESQYFTILGMKAYYFPVAPGFWGSYGTTQENNGYVINVAKVSGVFFSETKPTSDNYGTACPTQVYGGRPYALPPSAGWLTIVVTEGSDVPSCHIAWSNGYDDVPGTFSNTVKAINADVQWIHAWGMAMLEGNGRTVYDEIVVGGKRYRRTDRAALDSMTWTQSTEVYDETTVYVYTSTVATMASGGLWKCLFPGLEISGKTLTVRDERIDTVEDLLAALFGYYFYFELETEANSNATVTADLTVNDFGLMYFLKETELATVAAFVEIGYYQSGKDQLFNAVTYQKILAEVLATALCNLDSRLSAIEGSIEDGFDYLKVVNLDVTRELTQPE